MLRPCFVLTGQPCAVFPQAGMDTFEVHLTTEPLEGERLAAYRAACLGLRVKAIVIELAPGLPVQPMTCLRVAGGYEDALTAAQTLGQQLEAQGFPTLRVKIEAAPWNTHVPLTDEDAAGEPTGRYFEFHARLLLSVGGDLTGVAAICRDHSAHLSRNPLKTWGDGQQERFVTLRVKGAGRATTEDRASTLAKALEEAGWAVTSTVLEYCIHDDHLELDEGWGRP